MMLTLMVWRQMRALFIPLRYKSVQGAVGVMVCLTGFRHEAATYLKEVPRVSQCTLACSMLVRQVVGALGIRYSSNLHAGSASTARVLAADVCALAAAPI